MCSELECAPVSLGTLLSDLLLGSLSLLSVAPLFLNSGGGLLLLVLLLAAVITVELHVRELLPQLLKLRIVLLDIVLVINNYKVFLVGVAGSDGPVEGAGDEVRAVDEHELVVHVGVGLVVDAHGDAPLREPVHVAALLVHALVVRDYLDLDAPLPGRVHSIRQLVIRHGEHADLDRFRRPVHVLDQTLHILFIWEKHSV